MDQQLQQYILNRFYIDEAGYICRKEASRGRPAGSVVAASTRQESRHMVFSLHWMGKTRGLSFGRVAWLLHHGSVPADGMEVDHVDRNPRNNRKENLRLATRTQQLWNTGGQRKGPKNVYFSKATKKWNVQLQVEGQVHGRYGFATEEEAAIAAQEMRTNLHGQFAIAKVNP